MAILNKMVAGMRKLSTEEVEQVSGGVSGGTMCQYTDEVNGTIVGQGTMQDDGLLD